MSGCEISKDFTLHDGHKIKYKKGMQGYCVREHTISQPLRLAVIFIRGVTEWGPGPGQQTAWVPYNWIKIAFVACLPKFVEQGRSKAAHWFTVTPSPDLEHEWEIHMARDVPFGSIKGTFKITPEISDERFIWILVSVHRRIVNKCLQEDPNLGKWINQYGKYIELQHISKTPPSQKLPFEFIPDLDYSGARISFQKLGAWILNSDASLKYVKLWEEANEAHVAYLMEQTVDNWEKFKERMERASALPP
ncbi:hypothetical protein yc1106_02166 [Curvularia clavata]|uniref:Uncharacterized protein n=1 Tax=Curvularia clavata TaxID=95742 RepID=A0A9Q8Z2B7_CURCL|nr:hypothetical protein yc1106_02166 [Curvularia clavata]